MGESAAALTGRSAPSVDISGIVGSAGTSGTAGMDGVEGTARRRRDKLMESAGIRSSAEIVLAGWRQMA